MTESALQLRAVPNDAGRGCRHAQDGGTARRSVRRLLVCFGVGVAGLVGLSAIACAHEFAHGAGRGGAGATFVVVLGLPVLVGFVGGIATVRCRSRRSSKTIHRESSITIGLLLVGLGVASLFPAVTGHLWLSVAGGTIGAVITLLVADRWTPSGFGCRHHSELTLGVIVTHRLLEGVVLGTLYSAGAAVGLLGTVVLAGHTALETAAVGGLYATTPRRTLAVSAVVFVQISYVIGAAAGLSIADLVPVSVRTLALAVVGGALLVVGAGETERSIVAGDSTLSENT